MKAASGAVAVRRAQGLVYGLMLIAFAAGFTKALERPPVALFQPQAFAVPAMDAPTIQTRFVSTSPGSHRHAPSLVELSDGRIRAFWFSGSYEGASNVEIRSAVFDPRSDRWGAEQTVIDRASTQRALLRYVKKLGNPVAARAADGTLHLYFVTVSLGGWSTSSLTTISSSDDGETWGPARRLITSPFLNISTLVKGTPFHYADGTIGLPVYHQLFGRFGELLHLDTAGAVLDKQRLSDGRKSLQPVVLVRDGKRAQVLMRHRGGGPKRLIGTSTEDAGRHWTSPVNTPLDNPDAAVTGVALPSGPLLAVVNNLEWNRDMLSLVASSDGGVSWRTIYTLEDHRASFERLRAPASYAEGIKALALATDASLSDAAVFAEAASQQMCYGQHCEFEVSYPYLILTSSGDAQLVYSWNRSFIKHVEFSRAWIEQHLKEY